MHRAIIGLLSRGNCARTHAVHNCAEYRAGVPRGLTQCMLLIDMGMHKKSKSCSPAAQDSFYVCKRDRMPSISARGNNVTPSCDGRNGV